jgi:hypothetical protein
MLKARSGNTILIGLNAENVARLTGGVQAILIRGGELGLDPELRIGIFYGEHDADLARKLEEVTGKVNAP